MIHLNQPITRHISKLVTDWYGVPLESLTDDFHYKGDQGSYNHKEAYRNVDKPIFKDLYNLLVRGVMYDLRLDPVVWCVQDVPTFRFHYPKSLKTKEFHRDSEYGHPIQSLNVLVPLTQMGASNAPQIETVPYSTKYEEMYGEPGSVIVFNGAVQRHGTYRNKTGQTRVSFDFRFAHKDKLTGNPSINAGKLLMLGVYYREL